MRKQSKGTEGVCWESPGVNEGLQNCGGHRGSDGSWVLGTLVSGSESWIPLVVLAKSVL